MQCGGALAKRPLMQCGGAPVERPLMQYVAKCRQERPLTQCGWRQSI